MALTKIPANLLDKSAHVDFADDERLRLGTGNDLQIYHDASNSIIKDAGTGNLELHATNLVFKNADSSLQYASFISGGAAELRYNGSPKLATSSAGATVTGTLTVTGDLDITGNVNSASVTDLDVTDKTITLGVGQTEAQSDSSGIIIDGSNASLLWDETNDEFVFNKNLKSGGIQLAIDTTSYNQDATLSYYAANNGVYLNGAGTNGWLRLNASGVSNSRTAIDLFGQAGGDYIRIKAANTDTMWIGSGAAGRVGILTSNPSVPLDVSGHVRFGDGGTAVSVDLYATDRAVIKINGTEKLRIKADGNVGIGTASPSAPLHIDAAGMGDVYSGRIENTTTDTDHYNVVRWFQGSSGSATGMIGTGGSTTGNVGFRNTFVVGTQNAKDLVLMSADTERMRITSSGDIGINTTSPISGSKLDVTDTDDMTMRVRSTGASSSAIRFQNSGTGTTTEDGLFVGIGAGKDGYLWNYEDVPIVFATNNTERMRLSSDGNLGIGDSTPTLGKLEVHGGGSSGFSTLHLQATTSTQFNHSVNAFNSNLTNGENNLIVIGREGSTRNSAWMGYKWYSAASYSNCLTFGHWGNNNIVNLNGYGVLMAGGLETAPNYPGAMTTARTGSSSTTTQATWGFSATAGGSNKDFGYKASGAGSYAYGVLNAAETAWMSRLDFNGAIHLTNTTVQNISDRRLKKNIVDANSQWDDIKGLQFKNFKWKDEARGTDTYLGLIADEVESVSPGLVGIEAVSAETMPDDGIDPEYKNVKYSIVWMKAVKALQEAMAKIETLEAKVKTLEEG